MQSTKIKTMPNKHTDKANKEAINELEILMNKIELLIDVEHYKVKDYLQKRFIDSVKNQSSHILKEKIKRLK